MSGVKYVGLLLIILATCSNIHGGQLNSLCKLVKDGTKLSNPSSCASYYSCNGGVATLSECGANKAFNKDRQACIAGSQTDCQISKGDPCNGKVDTRVPNTSDCNAYYYCDETSEALAAKCPRGQHFNADTNSCITESESTCLDGNTSEVENICLLLPNGVLFGSSSDCAAYSYCLNNELRSDNTCETLVPNTVYNVQTQQCVNLSTYSCPQLLDDQPQNGGNSSFEITLPVPNSCIFFYKYNNQQYKLQQCPDDLYYDTVSGSCVSQLHARNNCDRCVGNNLQFVNAYSTTDCTKYIRCIKGVAQNTDTCPRGAYFNQVAGKCQLNFPQPNFGCCNPAVFKSNK